MSEQENIRVICDTCHKTRLDCVEVVQCGCGNVSCCHEMMYVIEPNPDGTGIRVFCITCWNEMMEIINNL